jgi:hypothetical protein
METSNEELGELERQLAPHFMLAIFPGLLTILGAFAFFAPLHQLVGAYNYLRGMPSPLDQAVLTLLGSDLSRLVIVILSIVGLLMGVFLSRFTTEKLAALKRDGAVELSIKMYLILSSLWWTVPWCFFIITQFYERFAYGMTSHFTSALGFSILGGYLIGFSVPILVRFIQVVLYSRSIDSQVVLEGRRTGSGIIRPLKNLTIRITPQDSSP